MSTPSTEITPIQLKVRGLTLRVDASLEKLQLFARQIERIVQLAQSELSPQLQAQKIHLLDEFPQVVANVKQYLEQLQSESAQLQASYATYRAELLDQQPLGGELLYQLDQNKHHLAQIKHCLQQVTPTLQKLEKIYLAWYPPEEEPEEGSTQATVSCQATREQLATALTPLANHREMRKLYKQLRKMQKPLQKLLQGDLNQQNLEQLANLLAQTTIVAQPNFVTHRENLAHVKRLVNHQSNLQKHAATISAWLKQLQEIALQIALPIAATQLQLPPLMMGKKPLAALLKVRELHQGLQTTLAPLWLRMQLLASKVREKQQLLHQSFSQFNHRFFPHVKKTLAMDLRPLTQPDQLHTDWQVYYSDNRLPVYMNHSQMQFYAQSHLAKHKRKVRAGENVSAYTQNNEYDVVRQMVDQAICNQWPVLKFSGHNKNFVMLACAYALAREQQVDWQHLGNPSFQYSPRFKALLMQEQARLRHQPLVAKESLAPTPRPTVTARMA